MNNIKELKNFYHDALMRSVEFWEKSDLVDKEYGGCITSVDREGKMYNPEKSVWFQGRCLFTFSALCRQYGIKENWLEAAESTKEFMEKYCVDEDGRMFFTVTRDGQPLRKRRYMYSESFYAISMAEYGALKNDADALKKAKNCFDLMLRLYDNPESDPFKITPKSTRAERGAAVPMVLISTAQVLRRCDPDNAEYYTECAERVIGDMLKYHYKPELQRVLETVLPDGGFIDTPAGRTINPGHSCENAWFLMNEAVYTDNSELMQTALDILEGAMEEGWDDEFGGIIYFSDVLGRPCEQLEHDMKLWWVHCEALIGNIYAYMITKKQKYFDAFMKLHEYSFAHFEDKEFGEWYGYLHKDGTVSHTQKGSMWKGPYHLQRALMTIERILEGIEKDEKPFCIL